MAILKIFGSGGSEGIPSLFCNCNSCKNMKKRKRVGYALEIGKTSIWLELSPDLREQLLEYGRFPDYFFVSHLHFDHIYGINELRQGLDIGKTKKVKKVRLLLPTHIYNHFESIRPFSSFLQESIGHSFWEMYFKGILLIKKLEPSKWFKLKDIKILAINNVHKGVISTSLFVHYKNKNFLYLSDAEKLDEEIFEITKKYIVDLVIAHTPFINRHKGHLGIEDLNQINAKKIVLSHFSHKLNIDEKRLEQIVKKYGKRYVIGFDGLEIKF